MYLNKLATVLGAATIIITGILLLTAGKVSAATLTWTGDGLDNNFSTGDNWSGDAAPEDGDTINIDNTGGGLLLLTNDIAGLDLKDINVTGDQVNIDNDGTTLGITGIVSVESDGHFNITGTGVNIHSDGVVGESRTFLIDGQFSIDVDTFGISNAVNLTVENADYDDLSPTSEISALARVDLWGNSFSGEDSSITLKGLRVSSLGIGDDENVGVEFDKSIYIIWAPANTDLGAPSTGTTFINSQILKTTSGSDDDTDLEENFSINGNLFGADGENAPLEGKEAIVVDDDGGDGDLVLSGDITLLSDIVVNPKTANIVMSGTLAGDFWIGSSQEFGEDRNLILNTSSNTTKLPDGTWDIIVEDTTISDVKSGVDVYIQAGKTVTINGERRNVTIADGGTLKGTGTVGNITALADSHVAPGTSPGCIDAGNTTLSAGSNFDVEIGGTVGCSGYDRLNVTGTVDVTGAVLNISFVNDFIPKVGDEFVIINNDSVDAIAGTFNDLSEGDTVKIDGVTFMVSYDGGGGENDVVLTVVDVNADAPGSPNTGAAGIKANPALTGIATIASSGAIALIARRLKLFS